MATRNGCHFFCRSAGKSLIFLNLPRFQGCCVTMHLYLHIPFCKKACHYCDFHFSTNASLKLELVEAMARELILQKEYLPDNSLETVYFGGGTPSLLSEAELDLLLSTLHKHYEVRGGRRNYVGGQSGRPEHVSNKPLDSDRGKPAEYRHSVV